MELKEYPDAEMMMMDLADRLASELRAALAQRDTVSLAVPGGTTPGPVFDVLSGMGLDWDRVHVMLTDERWVPEDSPRSNTRLLRERLLTGRAAAARLVPLYLPGAEPEDRLDEIAEGLAPALPLDVVLLGMGADMHTASLFPGADRLEEALTGSAPVVAMRAPGAPEPRVTLSARVLREAMSLHIVITGREKREALERARHLTPQEAPVAAVLKQAMVHWAES
ncbi:6-phosphogluconolactonase [Histidinibacterium lentulum]|uniref:6-phosphogluconolactonase n=1 Tax=Histidinibacterium lentulum TaxID=2480588 RepID=A0A3N2R9C5_9RHOB|nr:6-phosphogluconolactonase [Histidinibacterium lentulum]ROU04079.1 6-phosphogluconolactonase [Histidinibacterium lentulum]